MSSSLTRLLSFSVGKVSRLQSSSCCRIYGIHRRTLVHVSRLLPSTRLQLPGIEAARKEKLFTPYQLLYWNRSLASATTATSAGVDLPPGYIPEPPVPPAFSDSGTSELLNQLNALGEPTLQSLGLGSWFPNGIVQLALESLHVSLDIPWWTSIVIGTVIVRLLMFPLVILGQRNVAHTHNHSPIMQSMQAKYTKARQSGNAIETARCATELGNYMKKHNVSPLKQMLMPFCQLPVFLSVFVGIRQMANLPVDSMTTGGMAWFTDLTIPDPYYALPVLTMATFLCTLEFGVDGVRAESLSRNMRYAMRAMPFIMLPFIINFPSAMLVYWFTTNIFSFVQMLFLKIDPVRKYFKIPKMVKHDPSILNQDQKPFFKTIKETYRNSKTAFDVGEMQRQEAVKFKEAGLGAIQKTYSYDPTKVAKNTSVNTKPK